MIRILVFTFRRFFSRDAVRVIGLIALAAAVLGGVGAFMASTGAPPHLDRKFDAAIRASRTNLEARIEQCVQQFANQVRCEKQLVRPVPPEKDARFIYGGVLPGVFESLRFPFALLSVIIGATMAGAEWGAGFMVTLLTWEPRRWVVYLGSLMSLSLAAVLAYLLVELLLALTLAPAGLKGSFAGIDMIWLKDVSKVTALGGALTAGGVILGFSVASLTRNTVAAVGGMVVYLIIEPFIGFNLEIGRWLITTNAAALLSQDSFFNRTPNEAAITLAAYAAALTTVAGILFSRRSVQ